MEKSTIPLRCQGAEISNIRAHNKGKVRLVIPMWIPADSTKTLVKPPSEITGPSQKNKLRKDKCIV